MKRDWAASYPTPRTTVYFRTAVANRLPACERSTLVAQQQPQAKTLVGGCMSTPCNWSAGRYPALRVAKQVPPQARSVTQAFINGGIFSLLAPVLHFCSNRQDAAMICRFWVALWLAWDRWVSVCLRQALSSQALLRRWLQCKVNSPHCCYNPQSPEKPVDGVCAIPVQNHCAAQPEDPALIFTFLLQSLFFLFFSVFGIRVDPPRDSQIWAPLSRSTQNSWLMVRHELLWASSTVPHSLVFKIWVWILIISFYLPFFFFN